MARLMKSTRASPCSPNPSRPAGTIEQSRLQRVEFLTFHRPDAFSSTRSPLPEFLAARFEYVLERLLGRLGRLRLSPEHPEQLSAKIGLVYDIITASAVLVHLAARPRRHRGAERRARGAVGPARQGELPETVDEKRAAVGYGPMGGGDAALKPTSIPPSFACQPATAGRAGDDRHAVGPQHVQFAQPPAEPRPPRGRRCRRRAGSRNHASRRSVAV
jgi:hypothetical protein